MDSKILNKFEITENEKQFISNSKTATTSDINHSRIISDIYLSKTLETITNKIITSNKLLSDSNNKYTKGMLFLTGGLLFIGIIQIIIQAVQIYLAYKNY